MSGHESVSCPQVLRLFLQGVPGHLAHHGALAVDHLVMGEHQHKVLAVGVKHGEGQLPVMIVAEIGIAFHIAEEIIHPSHVPLIVKAQAAVRRLARNHRPGRGLLGDENRPVLSPLKHGVQVL